MLFYFFIWSFTLCVHFITYFVCLSTVPILLVFHLIFHVHQFLLFFFQSSEKSCGKQSDHAHDHTGGNQNKRNLFPESVKQKSIHHLSRRLGAHGNGRRISHHLADQMIRCVLLDHRHHKDRKDADSDLHAAKGCYIDSVFYNRIRPGKNIIPAGSMHMPIAASARDRLRNLSFPVRSPAAMLPAIVAMASVLSAAP